MRLQTDLSSVSSYKDNFAANSGRWTISITENDFEWKCELY